MNTLQPHYEAVVYIYKFGYKTVEVWLCVYETLIITLFCYNTVFTSLERTERMMVRWMCGVSLKDRKRSVDLYSLLGVQSVADVVRRGRLRWFGYLEHRSLDDWVSACRKVEVAGARCEGRKRKTCVWMMT